VSQPLSFREAWREYWEYLTVTKGLRRSSISRYRQTLDDFDRHMRAHHRQWWQASPRDCADFLRRPARHPAAHGRVIAASTARGYYHALAGFFGWALLDGHIPLDPMRKVAVPKRPSPRRRALAAADLRSILVWVEAQRDPRLLVCFWLAFGFGMRVSEIAAARVEHVQLRGDRPHIWVPPGKTDRDRVVPVPDLPACRDAIAAYLAQRPGTGPLVDSTKRPGRHLAPGTVGFMLGTAMKQAGVNESPHALRHSYATLLLKAGRGQNLLAVSKLLGHASTWLVENVYGNSYPGPIDETAALLPDPRAANGSKVSEARTLPDLGDLAWLLPIDQADQLAAALRTLEAHAPEVAAAMATVQQVTQRAWLRSLGLERVEQLRTFDAEHADLISDDDWDRFEAVSGIHRAWELADMVRDAHPDG
jgi:integrase